MVAQQNSEQQILEALAQTFSLNPILKQPVSCGYKNDHPQELTLHDRIPLQLTMMMVMVGILIATNITTTAIATSIFYSKQYHQEPETPQPSASEGLLRQLQLSLCQCRSD